MTFNFLPRALLRAALIALPLALSGLAGPAGAEDASPAAPTTAPAATQSPQARLDAWKAEIDQIATATKREGLSDRQLEELRVRADGLRSNALGVATEVAPALTAAQTRLKQIAAPAKQEGSDAPVESDAIKQERRDQEKVVAELDGYVKQAGVIQLKADEVIQTIGDIRRDRFTKTLFAKTNSLLDPSLWIQAGAATPRTMSSVLSLMSDWTGLLVERATESSWAIIALSVLVFGLLVRPVRRRLVTATERDAQAIEPPTYGKALAATAIVIVNVALPVAGLLAIQLTLRVLDLAPERIDHSLRALIEATFSATMIWGLALAVLAPGKPQWRMLALSDSVANRLVGMFVLLATVYGIGTFLVEMTVAVFAPVSIAVTVSGMSALADVAVIMLILRTTARALGAEEEQGEDGAGAAEAPHRSRLWRWLVPLAWLAAIAAMLSAGFGYVALARFIVTEMVWAGSIFAALFLLLTLVDETISAALMPSTRLSESLINSMGLARSTVEQLGVVLSGVVRIAMICVAFVLILLPLGYSFADMGEAARTAFFGFQLGGFTFAPSTILVALVIFLVGLAVTRSSQTWLEERFLPRTSLDPGVKNSIRTTFGYVGFVISVMIALSSAGIGLENIALVAGGLSVGIGFGMQSIANNFVSGLILLVERPIKAGDLVEIGSDKGIVRKINVRSTEIETGDRASLIVPNSSLITGSVKNWMHRDPSGQCKIAIGVQHGSDPDKVKEILLACAREHKSVLLFPAPGAFFVDFTETALRFTLYATVGNVGEAFGVESDLRFAIMRRLKENHIEIAQTPRSIRIEQLGDLVIASDEDPPKRDR